METLFLNMELYHHHFNYILIFFRHAMSQDHIHIYEGHFINNALRSSTMERMMQHQWKWHKVTDEDLRMQYICLTSLKQVVLNWRVLEMASSGTSGTVTVDPNKDNGGRWRFCGKHQSFGGKHRLTIWIIWRGVVP